MPHPLTVTLLSAEQAEQIPDSHLLSSFHFDDGIVTPEPSRVVVPLATLGARSLVESWSCYQPIQQSELGAGFAFRASADYLLGHVWLEIATDGDFQTASHNAYQQILQFVSGRPQQHLLRIWNFMPTINEGTGDQERYRQFCVGRHEAFCEHFGDQRLQYPAATAIGGGQGLLLISFLSSTSPGQVMENPRQVSAFKYPRQYGPRSPSFSRATLLRWPNDSASMLVSGTASVVGHESRHADALIDQLHETARNLEALQDASGRHLNPQALRIYIRDANDYEPLSAALREHSSLDVPAVFLRGDICRQDLLLEIEAVYSNE